MTAAAPVLLTDSDLTRLRPRAAVDRMVAVLDGRVAGRTVSPPRVSADLGEGRAVLTAGRGDGWYGYRVYDTLPTTVADQVVVAHDADGRVAAVHVGERLGALRTGALGGVAARVLGPAGPTRVAVVGAGPQAWAQLWAVSGELDVTAVRVASRASASREAFARRARLELGLDAVAAPSPREAVEGAGVVVLATTSPTPVVDAGWLAEDVLVHTVGPKQVERAEFPLDLVTGAALVATDSPEQLAAYEPPALVAARGDLARVVDLADVVGGRHPGRRTRRRVYLSVGLAGSEAALLHHLATEGS
ncbi:hypothetical protein [Kytococcus sp. Marseille-QA3725]